MPILHREIDKSIRIMFPENQLDRVQCVLKRLRDNNAKDHHVPGSLTWLGRCAVDNAAADIIEQLDSRVPRWISVKERLPERWRANDKDRTLINYLVYMPEYGVDVGNWVKDAKMWVVMGLPAKVTHWMPLPEPPKEE